MPPSLQNHRCMHPFFLALGGLLALLVSLFCIWYPAAARGHFPCLRFGAGSSEGDPEAEWLSTGGGSLGVCTPSPDMRTHVPKFLWRLVLVCFCQSLSACPPIRSPIARRSASSTACAWDWTFGLSFFGSLVLSLNLAAHLMLSCVERGTCKWSGRLASLCACSADLCGSAE